MIDLNYDLGEYSAEITKEMIDYLKVIIGEALNVHALNDNYEISLTFVDDEEIRIINKQYRKKDTKTDVLSFPMFTKEEIGIMRKNENSNDSGMFELLGDIIISVPTAKDQAKEYNHSFTREICFLVCHSILHLLGYDHENLEDTKMMQAMERHILEKAEITRDH